jgi:hypothetical protein
MAKKKRTPRTAKASATGRSKKSKSTKRTDIHGVEAKGKTSGSASGEGSLGTGVGASSTGSQQSAFQRGAVSVIPTLYPDSPTGPITVQNFVTIDVQTPEFARFKNNLEALVAELSQSNRVSEEVRQQLLSELKAGRELIKAPKPQLDLLNLLLIKPLEFLIEKSDSAIIAKLAHDALEWLLKLIA